MQITVIINNCKECRYIDHSGSFTVRGARIICGHHDACKARRPKSAFRSEYPEYANKNISSWKHHWYNRVISLKWIPPWCPLKHGSQY